MCMFSCSVMSNLCDPMDYSPPGSSVYGIFPGKNTGRDSPGDLPDPGIELVSPALQADSYHWATSGVGARINVLVELLHAGSPEGELAHCLHQPLQAACLPWPHVPSSHHSNLLLPSSHCLLLSLTPITHITQDHLPISRSLTQLHPQSHFKYVRQCIHRSQRWGPFFGGRYVI